jgi:hypothetical protein
MKAPAILVSIALALAILLAASFLIATGTRGEDALRPLTSGQLSQDRSHLTEKIATMAPVRSTAL